MIIIFNNTQVPYEYQFKRDALSHILSRCQEIKHSIRVIEKDKEHLALRCPMAGDILDIVATEFELDWLDRELRVRGLYKPSK